LLGITDPTEALLLDIEMASVYVPKEAPGASVASKIKARRARAGLSKYRV